MYLAQLHVGGLVAVGIDSYERYVLIVSHSGRGVFDTTTWQRVARDTELAYPVEGKCNGIGPLAEQLLEVVEINYTTGSLDDAPLGVSFVVSCEEGVATISSARKSHR